MQLFNRGNMNKYLFKAIFRDKFRNIILMVLVLFCVIASSIVFDNNKPLSKDELIYKNLGELQYGKSMYEGMQEFIDSASIDKNEKKGQIEYRKFTKWAYERNEKNLEMLKNGKYFTKEYQAELKKYELLADFFCLQRDSDVHQKTVAQACDAEMKKYNDYLQIDKLPFDYKWFPYVPQTSDMRTLYNQANGNYILQAKLLFSSIENGIIDYSTKSPYVFLSTVLGDINGFSVVLSLIILFFSVSIVMKWKNQKSFYCVCNMNATNSSFFNKYLKNIMLFLILIFTVSIGAFFIYWIKEGGLEGVRSLTPYAAENFKSFKTFDHLPMFNRLGISKMYYDYYFDWGNEASIDSGTRHPYAIMKVWQLFLLFGILAFIKTLFYTLIGAGIGFIFVDKSKIVISGLAVGVISLVSQLYFTKLKFNPFSVGNCLETTMGGQGMTWLNAMVVLIISIIVLYAGTVLVIRNKDVC